MSVALTRRRMLQGTSALGALGLVGCRQADTDLLTEAGTVDTYALESGFLETTIDGNRVRLRAYNGQVPGPLIETAPGHRLDISLDNQLPEYDSSAWNGDHNVPHHLGSTNLHVHGLDVIPHLFEPVGTSDPAAPMIAIKPGESLDYSFEIPDDHPPGLFWYHPHHHGSTVVQAVTGMAGPIIIKGPIDEVPAIKAARDITLAIQDIGLFPNDDDPELWSYEPKQNAIWQTFGGNVTIYDPETKKNVVQPELTTGFTTGDYALRYFMMNGEPFFKEEHNAASPQDPKATQMDVQTITIQPGEVVRLRMLNACSDNLMPIVVEGHEMHLLALDGVNFPAVRTIPEYEGTTGNGQVLLAPANRAEFLIQGSETPGTYKVLQLAQSQQFLESGQKTICNIVVEGDPKLMPLPTELPYSPRNYPLITPGEIKGTNTIEFGGTFPGVQNPYVGIDLYINEQLYDVEKISNTVSLNEAYEWHLKVGDEQHGGTEGHPFHIHVNAFEVISIGGVEQPPGTFMDTIWVHKDSEVVVRQRYKQWTGKAVYHCHILPHEDTGMMANFMIADTGVKPPE